MDLSACADVVRKPPETRESTSRNQHAEGSSELMQGQESLVFTSARMKNFRKGDTQEALVPVVNPRLKVVLGPPKKA